MKITYIVPRYLPHLGGVENHVAALATTFARDGHEVTVVTQQEGEHDLRNETLDNVSIKRFASHLSFKGQGMSPSLVRYVRGLSTNEAEVVHVHNVHAGTTLGVLAALRHPRIVTTPHYLGAADQTLVKALHHAYDPLLAKVLDKSREIICVSHAEAALLEKHFQLHPKPIRVIPNGVHVETIRSAPPAVSDGTVIFVAGRLEEYKQAALSLEAMVHLPHRFHLVIAGSGPQASALSSRAAELKVSDRVRMLGTLGSPEIAQWYRRANVFVAMSRRECFGMTLAESLTARCPIVASDIPAHREIIDGANWHPTRLLPVSASSSVLADAIVEMTSAVHDVRDPIVASWQDVAERTFSLYESVTFKDQDRRRPVALTEVDALS